MKRTLRGLTVALLAAAAIVSAPYTASAQLVVPDISLTNTKAHLTQFQTIANANNGTRRSTTAGYTASVTYVYDKLVAAGFTVAKQPCTSGCTSGAGPNVIADWPGGDGNNVYMFGAHLDSVTAGPGINDNGSGSATILEIALTLAANNPSMLNHVRFGWWTDEEQGLNGSEFYVNSLSSTDKAKIKAYFNFDMVASTNGGYFINRITSVPGQVLKTYYDTNFPSLAPEENVEGAGRSDDASFNSGGIQTSGVAAGASANKTSAQVTKWGGTTGDYDPCYHQACDTTSNIDDTVLNRAGDAAAYALWTLAVQDVAQNDFSLATSPNSGSVAPGSSVTTTVSATLTNGSAQTVNLTATGLPAGTTVSFSPSSISSNAGSSTLTVSTTASTPPGSYPISITGTGSSATRTTTFTLTVSSPPGCSGTNGNDVTISDNTTVTSSITISGCTGNAGSASTVEVHIVHTYIGDLKVDLLAPDGTVYTLHNHTGSGTDNINQTYTVNVSSEVANGTWKLQVNDNAGGDTGKIDTWTLNLGGTTPPACTGTNGTDVTIGDNTTVSSSIAINGCTGNASSTSKVEVHIVHTYIGDLKVDLIAPDGTVYTLHNHTGSGTDNINQTYTVNLSSEVKNGTWKLQVNDNAANDVGKIDSWTLTL